MSNVVYIPAITEDNRIGSVFNSLFQVFRATDIVEDDTIVWDFGKTNTEYFHPFFICPLAIYRSNYQRKISCTNIPSAVSHYFQIICFDGLFNIDGNTDYGEKLNAYRNATYLPICQLKLRGLDTDVLQSFLQDIIERQCNADRRITSPLSYMLGELIDNVATHSKKEYGYIYSQYVSKEKCIDICIADNGITVFGSYVRAHKYLNKINNDETVALQLAMAGFSTKNLPDAENRGFGLSTSKNILVNGLGGAFFMLSGYAFR